MLAKQNNAKKSASTIGKRPRYCEQDLSNSIVEQTRPDKCFSQ